MPEGVWPKQVYPEDDPIFTIYGIVWLDIIDMGVFVQGGNYVYYIFWTIKNILTIPST